MLSGIVDSLIQSVGEGEALWPGLGTFSLQERRNMPGMPGFRRLQFRPAEALYRELNRTDGSPALDAARTDWASDPARAQRTSEVVRDELARTGEVAVPGLGTFAVSERKQSEEDTHLWVDFRPEVALIRRLNPIEKNFAVALRLDFPDGAPEDGAAEA